MVVRELRKMANESKAAGKIAPRSADEKLKWLEWPEFVTVRLISPLPALLCPLPAQNSLCLQGVKLVAQPVANCSIL